MVNKRGRREAPGRRAAAGQGRAGRAARRALHGLPAPHQPVVVSKAVQPGGDGADGGGEEEWFTESDNRIQKEEQELSWMEGRKGHI